MKLDVNALPGLAPRTNDRQPGWWARTLQLAEAHAQPLAWIVSAGLIAVATITLLNRHVWRDHLHFFWDLKVYVATMQAQVSGLDPYARTMLGTFGISPDYLVTTPPAVTRLLGLLGGPLQVDQATWLLATAHLVALAATVAWSARMFFGPHAAMLALAAAACFGRFAATGIVSLGAANLGTLLHGLVLLALGPGLLARRWGSAFAVILLATLFKPFYLAYLLVQAAAQGWPWRLPRGHRVRLWTAAGPGKADRQEVPLQGPTMIRSQLRRVCRMRRPARFVRPAAIIPLAAIIGCLVGIGPGLAQQPQCRFPGPFNRVGVPIHHAAKGGPLSPLQIVADPSVVRLGRDRYRMWFTNADSRQRTGIAQADSADGIAFAPWRSASARDPIMDLAMAPREGDWDGPGAETAHVLRGPDGLWRMYYTGNRPPVGSVTYAIGLATSPDGERWTRRDRPVLEPVAAWERPICTNAADPATCRAGGVLEPSVLFDHAMGRYRMWYVGLGEPANSFRSFRIGHATSIDGVAWQRTGMPTFPLGQRGTWDEMWTSHVNVVADPKAGFHMFYFGSATADYREGIEIQRGAIGHAYSPDGLTLARNPANPILAPRDGGPDAWSTGGPTALIEDGKVRLWYFGSPTGGLASQVILAEAKCGP